eukprot:CAMPEP_0116851288 /NCGR_PEP_ID=MMETSP0418-20121206/16630_1 /TAXON_ID=1158023 /ORGANISM="Astrosyne radiata, Strain 13vi08-1A" /LENGTH=121 /DNA_ID=CAMNT_0004483275 /DNA_START=225 /DNA_END=590 /DNA_ORIENTATION=+
MEIFDIETGKWTRGPNMLTGRSGCASVLFRGLVLVVGGYNRKCEPRLLDVVEAFDPIKQEWMSLQSMKKRRRDCSAAIIVDDDDNNNNNNNNNKIMVVGGWDDENNVTTEVLEVPDKLLTL